MTEHRLDEATKHQTDQTTECIPKDVIIPDKAKKHRIEHAMEQTGQGNETQNRTGNETQNGTGNETQTGQGKETQNRPENRTQTRRGNKTQKRSHGTQTGQGNEIDWTR